MSPHSHRSPATLATRLGKILSMAVGHLPRLAVLGGQLQQQAGWGLRGAERALTGLHRSITALEPGAADGQAVAGEAEPVRVGMERAASETLAFMHRTAMPAAELRPLLAEFLVEFRGVERVVDRADDWLREIEQEIGRRQARDTDPVKLLVLAEVAEYAGALRSRLALLHAVVRSGRNTHALAEHLIRTRPKLSDTVEGQLRRTCGVLEKRLQEAQAEQAGEPLLGRPLQAARSDAQIWVAQALSLLLRLRASQDRLAREAAALRHRCGLLPQPVHQLEPMPDPAWGRLELRENMAEAS